MVAADALAELIKAAQVDGPEGGRSLPPVHLWHPAHCGEIDIVIRTDGLWMHEGTPIGRPELVRLFSTVLRKDPDGFHLVTPVEKLKITVEDAPFVAVRVDRAGEALRFVTNVGDVVEAGPGHPIRVDMDPVTEQPRPYLHVRADLEALIARAVFYELVGMGEAAAGRLSIASNGERFDLGPLEFRRLTFDRRFIASRLDPLDGWRERAAMPDTETAAVLAPLVERPDGWGVILTVRPTTLRRHPGQIAFPGGRADPGERPWETALREAEEEIALPREDVEVLGLLEPFRVGGWFDATPVVGVVPPDFKPVPNPEEVAEVFETPLAFLMDAANHQPHDVTTPDGTRYTTIAMPWGERFIWGATAHMLHSLHRRLTQA